MDIDALRTCLAIHRHGGISPAAETLHRTQPAITRRLAVLEASLGTPLFERGAKRLILTQAGRALLPFAERAIAALQDAQAAVRDVASAQSGDVKLAIVGTLADARLAEVLRRLRERRPRVIVNLTTATSRRVSRAVARGEVDIGVRYETDPAPELELVALAPEPMAVICAPDHRYAGQKVDLAHLREERWLAFPSAPDRALTSPAHVYGLFLARGFGEIAWTPIDSLTAQKRLVEAGLGVAMVASSAVDEERTRGTLALIEVEGQTPSQSVSLVTRKGGFLSQAAIELIALITEAFGRDDAGECSPSSNAASSVHPKSNEVTREK
jgi:DNA-binding transcriptional LysR family regulator